MCNELVKRILYALVIFIAPYRNLFVFPIIKFMSSLRPDLVVFTTIQFRQNVRPLTKYCNIMSICKQSACETF